MKYEKYFVVSGTEHKFLLMWILICFILQTSDFYRAF